MMPFRGDGGDFLRVLGHESGLVQGNRWDAAMSWHWPDFFNRNARCSFSSAPLRFEPMAKIAIHSRSTLVRSGLVERNQRDRHSRDEPDNEICSLLR